jgi:hypothetical protein
LTDWRSAGRRRPGGRPRAVSCGWRHSAAAAWLLAAAAWLLAAAARPSAAQRLAGRRRLAVVLVLCRAGGGCRGRLTDRSAGSRLGGRARALRCGRQRLTSAVRLVAEGGRPGRAVPSGWRLPAAVERSLLARLGRRGPVAWIASARAAMVLCQLPRRGTAAGGGAGQTVLFGGCWNHAVTLGLPSDKNSVIHSPGEVVLRHERAAASLRP